MENTLMARDLRRSPHQAEYAGFFDFVENRFTEFSKEGKEWKFSLVEALAANPVSTVALPGGGGPQRAAALRTMLTQGPFYVPWRPEGPMAV